MRTMPAVKDSQWVRKRADLEKNKDKDTNEVILLDEHGNIYEGMASNLFAVRQRSEEELKNSMILIGQSMLLYVLLWNIYY